MICEFLLTGSIAMISGQHLASFWRSRGDSASQVPVRMGYTVLMSTNRNKVLPRDLVNQKMLVIDHLCTKTAPDTDCPIDRFTPS